MVYRKILYFYWTHQAMYTTGAIEIYHVIQNVICLPNPAMVFNPILACQGHFLELVGKINMFFLKKLSFQ